MKNTAAGIWAHAKPAIKRRSFLAGVGALAALLPARSRTADAQADGAAIPARKLERLALSSSSYRANYDDPRFAVAAAMPRLSHLTFPAFVKERFGMRRVELWDQQFGPQGHTAEQCKLIRAAADQAGVSIVSVEVEDLPGLGQSDKAARAKALDECKVWLDKGRILGAGSIRVNVSRRNDPVDVDAAVETLRAAAGYARSIGLHLLLENHGGYTASIPAMIALVKSVNDDHLRIELDWGAWSAPGDRYADLQSAMPYVYLVSSKGEIFDETTYEHTSYDIGRIVRNAEAGGFRGVYSIELYATPAPRDTERAVRSMMKTIADNMA